MGDVITNLKAKFGVESKDVVKGTTEGGDALLKLDKKVEKTILGFKNMFTPIALLGAAGGALAVLKSSIESIEGPADRFESVLGGSKEALFELQKALGTMDFSGFFTNLSEGYERGKKLTEALDELADRAAYNDYKIAQLNRESESLQEITKNKTLELSVRADAAEKVKEIESRIVKRKIELAQEEFEIAKDQWEGRNKMEAEQAVKLYETIDNMGPELRARLQKAFETSTGNQLGSIKKGIQSVLYGQYDPELIKEVDKETLESYGLFFKLIQTGEADVLIKLFNTFKAIDEAGYQAQREYNGIVASTTKLLQSENKELENKQKALGKIDRENNKVSKVKTGNLEMPLFGEPTSKNNLAGYTQQAVSVQTIWKTMLNASKSLRDEITSINTTIETAIESAVSGFGSWIGEFVTGMSGISELSQIIGNVFGDMLIQLGQIAIKTGIGIEAIKAAFSNLTGVGAIAIGIALVAFGSIIKSSVRSIPNSSAGSSGTTAGSYTYDTRGMGGNIQPLGMKLIGEFKIRGNDLVAVVENESNRRSKVT